MPKYNTRHKTFYITEPGNSLVFGTSQSFSYTDLEGDASYSCLDAVAAEFDMKVLQHSREAQEFILDNKLEDVSILVMVDRNVGSIGITITGRTLETAEEAAIRIAQEEERTRDRRRQEEALTKKEKNQLRQLLNKYPEELEVIRGVPVPEEE